jgi:hypothetical protein
MMARSVSVFTSGFRLGTNVTIQRRLLDITWQWIDNAGQTRTLTETVTFPDILADVPVAFRDDLLIEIATRLHRIRAGVDS